MLRAYSKTLWMSAVAQVGESPLFVADYLLRFLRAALLLSLWRMLMASGRQVDGYSLSLLLSYTLLSAVLADVLELRTRVDWALWDGSLSLRMLRPIGVPLQFLAEAGGRWLAALACFGVPLLIAAPWLNVSLRPVNLAAALLFPLSLIASVAVGLALEFCFAALVVALDQNAWALRRIQSATSVVLSGSLLPLALYPWGSGEALQWLPFAAAGSAPLRIYLGTGPALPLLAAQIAWAVALWWLAGRLWRSMRERLVCHGG